MKRFNKIIIVMLITGNLSGCASIDKFVKDKVALIKKKAQSLKRKKKNSNLPPHLKRQIPYLTKTKVRMYWEPDKIVGNKYVEKHRVWVIDSNPVWTKKD